MTVFRAKFKVELEIEGIRFKVSYFTSDWAMNQIPKGTCALAIGRDAWTGETPANVHDFFGDHTKMTKCKVWFSAEGEYSENENWPEEEKVIFDGRLEGIGHVKVNGKIHFAVHLVHWLADMDFSSSVSSLSHPANPKSYTFRAVFGAKLQANPGTGPPHGLSKTAEAKTITLPNVREDLWGKAIKPFLCAVARAEHVQIAGTLSDCVDLKAGRNDQAGNALARIEGASGDECDLPLSCYTPTLGLDDGGIIPDPVGEAIAEAIASESEESFVHQTLWGKLLQYSSAFMFSVVPLVDRALIVPFIPGLRETYCKRIDINDYEYTKQQSTLKRPTRAMAIYAGVHLSTNPLIGADNTQLKTGIGGCYAPADADEQGLLRIIQAPLWLRGLPVGGMSPNKTSGVKDKSATNSAVTPVNGKDNIKGNKNGDTKADTIISTREMYDRFAHASYVIESLRGRTGQLTGKLRFDIAPGSMVRIEGSTEKHIVADNDKLSKPQIGAVMRTSLSINAEQSKAGTSFTIYYLRSEGENADDKTSTEKHPLYANTFTGAPLTEDFQFEGCC
jgi:hypothetical protein